MTDAERGLTRRAVLGAAAAGTAGVALLGCGSGSGTKATTTRASVEAAPRRRGGTFRLGLSDSSSADSLDVAQADSNNSNVARASNLYDPLLLPDPTVQKFVPHLAESFDPAKDLSYWDIRLKDAEFHNGKPVTADDVIFSIRRVLDPKAPGSLAGLLGSVDTKRFKKLDARTVRMYLHFPDISIVSPFSLSGTGIVPVGYDPKNPIGTGPFKFKSFTPGVQSVFVRNDNYFISGRPYLDELVMIGFADPGTTRINALVSGQIDAADLVQPDNVATIEGNSNIKVIISDAKSYSTWEMRMDVAPFSDVRVRQAIKLLADRQQIVNQAYGNRFATIANDLPSRQDPLYNKAIPQRTQDIERAKALLKQAGHSDLRVQLAVAPGISTGVTQTAQVLAQQAKAAGVTININNVPDTATYFAKYYAQAPFKFSYFGTVPLFDHIGYSLLPSSGFNISNFRDPHFVKLDLEARGALDEVKRKELMDEAQRIMWDQGTQAIFAFARTADAHSTKFTGFKPAIWSSGLSNLVFDQVGLA